ncbi:hypothetical protein HON49_01955 [archaeon]|jgi:hypothetical protein|nr:hypothetical protein [archaeon]
MKKFFNALMTLLVISIILIISYMGLFNNDAISNLELIRAMFGGKGVILLNLFLIAIIIPISLGIMDIVTGDYGLERFKGVAAISLGMTTLGFAALQFINALTTSSAEGSTVIVEVFQQIAHLIKTGSLEQYGLVGMLTSDASGPWNSSIFPLIIIFVWAVRGKKATIEIKQLHFPMIFQFILYAQQFFFSLDLKYTLLEIILMLISSSAFIVGMLSIFLNMFKDAQESEEKAKTYVKEKKKKKEFFYKKFIDKISVFFFDIL